MNDTAEASTVSPRKRLSESQRRAIVAAYTVTGNQRLVAEQFGVHPNTVYTLVKSVRDVKHSVVSTDWRSDMRKNAVSAVNAGLEASDDPYKRAHIGVNVLKGLGDFAPDQGAVNISQLFASVPESVSRLLDTTTDGTPQLEDATIPANSLITQD